MERNVEPRHAGYVPVPTVRIWGVHQADSWFSGETSMPSCLIELGFITTADEERLLNDASGVGWYRPDKSIYEGLRNIAINTINPSRFLIGLRIQNRLPVYQDSFGYETGRRTSHYWGDELLRREERWSRWKPGATKAKTVQQNRRQNPQDAGSAEQTDATRTEL